MAKRTAANGADGAAAAKKPKKLSKAAQARADAAAAGLPEMPSGALTKLTETGTADARPAGVGRTKIVSWNVNGIRAMQKNQDRAEVLQAYMAAEQPDLLCIQETKLSGPSLDKKQEPAVGAWLAELRTISALFVQLPTLDSSAADIVEVAQHTVFAYNRILFFFKNIDFEGQFHIWGDFRNTEYFNYKLMVDILDIAQHMSAP